MYVCMYLPTTIYRSKICACVQFCRIKNNMADQNHEHACVNFPIQARCRLLAAHENFFVTNDEKYQTCLIFGLHVTNDENAVNVARTRGHFVDPTCHE